MPLRTFTDSDDIEWQVWDVIPRGVALDAPDRRLGAVDRRGGDEGAPGPWRGSERRAGGERRAMHVAPGMRGGWLTFQCADVKRRLAPIPHGWVDDTPEQLEEYCRAAAAVRRAR